MSNLHDPTGDIWKVVWNSPVLSDLREWDL
jgi:hypothetical protein